MPGKSWVNQIYAFLVAGPQDNVTKTMSPVHRDSWTLA